MLQLLGDESGDAVAPADGRAFGQFAGASEIDFEQLVFDRRIDFVLFRGDFEVKNATVVGDDPAGRTVSGRWPSDHAGVAAELVLPR